MSADLQLLRPRQVAEALAVHRSTIWRWVRAGTFPSPVQIGPNAVGFRRSAIEAWIESRESTGE